MKISVIISALLVAQVSASFLDVFQGAVLTVQNSFGKLFSDVVTDVKDTVDCTILAVEHVLSLSQDATARYYEKCGRSPNGTIIEKSKLAGGTTLEISILNNEEYLKNGIPAEIEARINATITKLLNGYNPHDKLIGIEKDLTKETERLANVNELVKQELDKLSKELHFNINNIEPNYSKPSVDSILEHLKLLEAIEKGIRNTSEAREIHIIIDNTLHKLKAIESADTTENTKVERILKDLEKVSNNSYTDLKQQIKDLKEEEARHIELIRKKLEEHDNTPEHVKFVQNSKKLSLTSTTELPNKKESTTLKTESPITKQSTSTSTLSPSTKQLTSSTTESSSTKQLPSSTTNTTTASPSTTVSASTKQLPSSTTVSPSTKQLSSTTNTFRLLSSTIVSPSTPSVIQPTTKQSTTVASTTKLLPSSTESSSTKQSTATTKESLRTAKKLESSTTPSTTTASIPNKVMTSTTIKTEKPKTPEHVSITTKLVNQQSSTSPVQTTDVSKSTTPVAIITNSYANERSHASSTETTVTIKSTTSTTISTTTLAPRTTNKVQPTKHHVKKTVKTTTPATTTTTVEDEDTSTMPTATTPKLSEESSPSQADQDEDNENIKTTSSTTTEEPVHSSTHRPTAPVPKLSEFLSYIDRLVASSTASPIKRGKIKPIHKPPPTVTPVHPYSKPPPYHRTDKPSGDSDFRPNPRFLPQKKPPSPAPKPIPDSLANFFKQLPTNLNEIPPLSTLPPSITPNAPNFNDPFFRMSPEEMQAQAKKKTKELQEEAMKEAQRVMEESRRSQRIIESMFNKRKQSAFNSASLKFGK